MVLHGHQKKHLSPKQNLVHCELNKYSHIDHSVISQRPATQSLPRAELVFAHHDYYVSARQSDLSHLLTTWRGELQLLIPLHEETLMKAHSIYPQCSYRGLQTISSFLLCRERAPPGAVDGWPATYGRPACFHIAWLCKGGATPPKKSLKTGILSLPSF